MTDNPLHPNIVFMFPGVGSHQTGMGKQLYDTFSLVKETFEEASDTLGFSLAELCFSPEHKGELDKLEHSQTSLVCLGVAAYRVFLHVIGLEPSYLMGYSLGEYTALCCAGALSFADTLRLVQERGRLVSDVAQRIDGTMAWVTNLPSTVVEEICRECTNEGNLVSVSAYDTPLKTSISGTKHAIRKAGEKVVERGGIALPIKMSGPFHSPMMQEVTHPFSHLLKSVSFASPRWPVIANRHAQPYRSAASIVENLTQQLVEPLRWLSSIAYVKEQGAEVAIELGPKNILQFLLSNNTRQITAYGLEKPADLAKLHAALFIQESEFKTMMAACLAVVAGTKNWNQDLSIYQEQVVCPFEHIQNLYEELEKKQIAPSRAQATLALQMAQGALRAKHVPPPYQYKYIKKIVGPKYFQLQEKEQEQRI